MSLEISWQIWAASLAIFLFNLPYYTYLLFSTTFTAIVTKFTRQRKSLEGETILVTGAASGIGQQVVWDLAKIFPSAVYVLWDINYKGLEQTQEKCNHLGASNVHIYRVDLSSREEIMQTAAQVKRAVGNVTLLYNNAGMGKNAKFLEADLDIIEKEMRVNFFAQMYTIREFLPDMVENGRGHIVSTCSGLAMYRFSSGCGYIASKYAVRGFMESLSLEMRQLPKEKDIKISVIYPGFVQTPLIENNFSVECRYPVVEPMKPEHVATQIVDGILKEKPEIYVPFFIWILDFLYRSLPTQLVDIMDKHVVKNIAFKQS